MVESDSELVRLCDSLTEVSAVLSRRPDLAEVVGAVGTATFAWAAAVAAEGYDPAAEITRVLSADPLLASSVSDSIPPAPETLPDHRGGP